MPFSFAGSIRTVGRAFFRRKHWEQDMAEELENHVQHRTDDLVRSGMPPADAERMARMELGCRESYKEECREAHGIRWFEHLRQDVRYALRSLWHSPGFAAVAVLSLALGIGANTVVLSVINSILLRPMPIENPQSVYFVQPGHGITHSYPNYREFRDRNSTLSGLIAYRISPMAVDSSDGAHRVWGLLATGNYFDVLGVRPAVGRFFHHEDDLRPGASPFAVLSFNCWRNRFGGDPDIAGKEVRINNRPYTVLGVAPRGFHGMEQFYWPDIWVPMMMQPEIEGNAWLDSRGTFDCWLVGRLKPGVTRAQAETNLTAISKALSQEYPDYNAASDIKLSTPGMAGDMGRGPVGAFMAGVMALAGLVLLAACVNIASLLAARGADRTRELAIRISIGAGKSRVFRQFLTEALVLAALGGAAGCGVAYFLANSLSRWRAPLDFPIQFDVMPDARVLLICIAGSLFSGIAFGLAPARQAWKADPSQLLKGMPSGRTHRRWAFRDVLIAVQVMLCCLLVTGCFVSLRGLKRAVQTPLGFNAKGAAVAGFDLGLARYAPTAGYGFQQRALQAVLQIPGVTAAAFASSVPLSIDQSSNSVFREGTVDFRPSNGVDAAAYDVSPGYFRAMGTRMIAGRDFTWHDDAKAPQVAIVNQTFARQIMGTLDAVGHSFFYLSKTRVQIVGVVDDGKYVSLTEQPRPAVFRPEGQRYNGTSVLIARSARPEAEISGEIRRVISQIDSRLPLYGTGSLTQMLGFAFFPSHAAAVALGAFGVLAIMLAVTGIYGLAAYSVSRRVREIGIRTAIGARPGQVLRFVLGRTATLLAAGSCAGLALGLAAGQALSSVVYQATGRDPVALLASAATLALIGLLATLGPARRALSIDPLNALRQD